MRRAAMRHRHLTIIVALCLALIVPVAAWGGQNLLIKGIEAQKAGKNEKAMELWPEWVSGLRRLRSLPRPSTATPEAPRLLKNAANARLRRAVFPKPWQTLTGPPS